MKPSTKTMPTQKTTLYGKLVVQGMNHELRHCRIGKVTLKPRPYQYPPLSWNDGVGDWRV